MTSYTSWITYLLDYVSLLSKKAYPIGNKFFQIYPFQNILGEALSFHLSLHLCPKRIWVRFTFTAPICNSRKFKKTVGPLGNICVQRKDYIAQGTHRKRSFYPITI